MVGVSICREGATVLTVTEQGKGRRTQIEDYRLTGRGGKGVRNYDAGKDKVAGIKIVDEEDDVLLSSQEGVIIRMHAADITIQSRYGSGVRVMRLGEDPTGSPSWPAPTTTTRPRPRNPRWRPATPNPPPRKWPRWKPPRRPRRLPKPPGPTTRARKTDRPITVCSKKEGMRFGRAYPLFASSAQEKQQGYPKPQL